MSESKQKNREKETGEPKQGEMNPAKNNPMGYMPVGKLLRSFALPAVISMLVNALYNIIDQIFIGRGVGYLGNAATTIAFPIITIVLAVSTLLGAGGSAYAALQLGKGKSREAERTLSNMFVLLVIAGVIMMILGLVFLEPLLSVFGATTESMPYAKDFASVLLLGVPFSMIGVGLSSMARTDGQPRLSMYSMLIGCVLNAILDPIYIFIFHWGVKGAAIATITSQILSAIILMCYFARKGNMRFKKADLFHLSGRVCSRMMGLGISSCIIQLAATLMMIVMNNSLVVYGNKTAVGGDVALSAMGIVLKVSAILLAVCVGVGIGAQPILGFNRGAKQLQRVRHTYLLAVGIATGIAIVGWAACVMIPNVLLSIFGTTNAAFFNFAVHAMRIYMLGSFTSGFQIVSSSYFQATGQPLKASILSMLRQLIILIPMILLLPTIFGLDGILMAGPIADFSSAVIVSCFAIVELRKLNSLIRREHEQNLEMEVEAA